MEIEEKLQVDSIEEGIYIEPKQSANTLFKFMKKEKYLKSILEKDAIIPRYNTEIIDYLKLDILDEIAFPMSCFCDININKIDLHTQKYGRYGIGLKKEWLYKNLDIEPIHYVNPESNEIKDFREAFKAALSDTENKSVQILSNYLLTSLLYMKPIQGKMIIDGKENNLCFHDEREWRYIPQINEKEITPILWGKTLNSNYMEICNKALERKRKYWLKFSPKDVNYITVGSEEDANYFAEIIYGKKNYNFEQKMDLISKIIILDNLGKDW